jgi:hypothetical protein
MSNTLKTRAESSSYEFLWLHVLCWLRSALLLLRKTIPTRIRDHLSARVVTQYCDDLLLDCC